MTSFYTLSPLRVNYANLIKHYEGCFNQHGPTYKGVDWPNHHDSLKRHQVMASLWQDDPCSPLKILDLGCGYGAFLTYLLESNEKKRFAYTGIDLAHTMIDWAQKHHPSHQFWVQDILHYPLAEQSFDYGIMNGVLLEKLGLTFNEMEQFAHHMILGLFKGCRRGIAFNLMNDHVDWHRPDFFHVPFDRIARFLTEHCSRHFRIHADYGLNEYTVFVYRNYIS
ncbi:MAG TPA: class I SAM-dependent methyltransferase [Candidatus Nitrosotenuis sp.]|jgi:SAM-dependent methyltransferase|nr:class I SAM-dependent methyltransferase [Candidatus Nitrosotenuis sp.]